MFIPNTFLKALEVLNQDLKKGKRYLKDKRLTQLEKNILECFFLLKRSKSKEVIEKLAKMSASDEIVESQRRLFLGIAYNNLTFFKEAEIELKQAFNLIEKTLFPRQKFIILHNLFILYFNQKNVSQCELCLHEMEKYCSDKISEISFLKAKMNLYSLVNNNKKSLEIIQHLNKLKSFMTEAQASSFLIEKFIIYAKDQRFDLCHKLIKEMRFLKSFHTSANYNFMKILLEHIDLDKPIYLNESDYKDYPILLYQIRCIKYLEEGNIDFAKRDWDQLVDFAPELYMKDSFQYNGEACLFSYALNKHTHLLQNKNLEMVETQGECLEDKLLNILDGANHPIPHGHLYKLIWGQEIQDKKELNKLAQMIYSIKKKKGIEIKSRKGCYFIISQRKSA